MCRGRNFWILDQILVTLLKLNKVFQDEFPHSYLPVAPQLVALHAVAVVQGDGAVVGHGVEADLLRVHGVAHPDVLPPAEREHLQVQRHILNSAQSNRNRFNV